MKPTKELIERVNALRTQFRREENEILIPKGGDVFFCGEDGSVDDGEDFKTIQMNIESWRENARTIREKGRAELANEQSAISRVVEKAKSLGFEIEKNGYGSGQFGSVDCYSLTHAKWVLP